MTNFATGSINDELLFRIDNSIESRLFHKIVILVSLGMLEASIGVYTGSAVASSLTASKWSTAQENSMLTFSKLFRTTHRFFNCWSNRRLQRKKSSISS